LTEGGTSGAGTAGEPGKVPLRLELQISLPALQAVALRRLQRLVDVMEVSYAGVRSLADEEYPAPHGFFGVYPSHNTRLGAAAAKEAARDWFALHCLRDAVEAISIFLEEARRCCALYSLSKRRHIRWGELHQVERDAARFHREGLPKKFVELKESYGVTSDFIDHILSVNQARNCIVHRDGVVSREDVDATDNLLTVRWLGLRMDVVSPDGSTTKSIHEPTPVEAGWSATLVTSPTSKSFPIGSHVRFTHEELSGILLSHLGCVNTLTESVQHFAEGLGVPFLTAPESDITTLPHTSPKGSHDPTDANGATHTG
jgi:hypothetical protein